MARPKGTVKIVFSEADILQLQKYAAVGLSLDQMADLMDISDNTLDQRIKSDPRVKSAIKKGRSTAIHNVGKSAYDQAMSGKVPAMTMFYLKCRAGWREKDKEPSAQETANHVVNALANIGGPVKELLEEIRAHRAKKNGK